MSQHTAFQDLIPHNHCFGCGPHNNIGLRIKSYWSERNRSICHFQPSHHHSAGPKEYLNGGIIATLIDCHCICTAIAKAYQLEERKIGTGELIWYVTGQLKVRYKHPSRIDKEVELHAEVQEIDERKIVVECDVYSDNRCCASGEVIAIRVSNDWTK